MAVIETSDQQLIFDLLEYKRVILKFHNDACGKVCQELKIVYEELSEEKAYKGITFLRLNGDDNPIAKKYLEEKKQPIMNIYLDGVLIECRTVGSRQLIEKLLDKLLKAN